MYDDDEELSTGPSLVSYMDHRKKLGSLMVYRQSRSANFEKLRARGRQLKEIRNFQLMELDLGYSMLSYEKKRAQAQVLLLEIEHVSANDPNIQNHQDTYNNNSNDNNFNDNDSYEDIFENFNNYQNNDTRAASKSFRRPPQPNSRFFPSNYFNRDNVNNSTHYKNNSNEINSSNNRGDPKVNFKFAKFSPLKM